MAGGNSRFGPKLNVNQNALSAAPKPKEPGIVSELLEPSEKPKAKGGRPKGPPTTKKTFYLTTDLARLEPIQINVSRHAGIRVKNESDTVDLALALLDYLAAMPEYAAIINNVYKNRLSK